jgi:hypothetical protein
MPIETIPAKKTHKDNLLVVVNLLYLKRVYPNNKLKTPHSTLINGDEFPNPGGSANGDGNGFPEMPLTKCGTKLAKNKPAKNAAK